MGDTSQFKVDLTATIVQDGPNEFVGWINELSGIVVQGESDEEVKGALYRGLIVKFELLKRRAQRKKMAVVPKNHKTEQISLQLR